MTITYEGVTEQTRQIVHHHAVLRRGLERRAGTLCEAVGERRPVPAADGDPAGIP